MRLWKCSALLQKITGLLLLMAIAMMVLGPTAALAWVPYDTNSKDGSGVILLTQPAYTPVSVTGHDLVEPDAAKPGMWRSSPMSEPKDLFIAPNDHLFVADTGNNRIVEFDGQGKWLRYLQVPESPLLRPEGIFVTDKGEIYVADTGNKRIVRLAPDGRFVRAYGRPESKYIPESFKYDPVRLVVDKRGYLYVATLGGYQGLLQLSPEGSFQSFYGANTTELSALDRLKRTLYSKKMYANEMSKLPGSISSVAVDRQGFIYTTTAGKVTKNQIKKLNIKGQGMLKKDLAFGEVRPWERRFVSGQGYLTPQLVDMAVDKYGNMFAVDSSYKMISQYDSNGKLLFFWGGSVSDETGRLGLLQSPIAIDTNSQGELFILDHKEGAVHRFRPSEFGALVNKANELTLQGRYEESEGLWRQVLHYNAFFTPAQLGLAKAAYKRGDYEAALSYFKLGGDRKGYSNAYWQLRLQWFQSHFSTLATAALLGVPALMLAEKLTRRSAWRTAWRRGVRKAPPIAGQLLHVFYVMRHPIDGFSAIRYEHKGGYASGLLLLAAAFGSLVFARMETGYIFNKTDPYRFHPAVLLAQFAVLFGGWVLCNYLISAILRGEGRFRDVFIAGCYSLFPLVAVGIPLTLVSKVMTESEGAIYDYIYYAMILWTLLMFFWNVQSVQNYSVQEAAVNVGFSVFSYVMAAVIAVILFGLSSDLRSFLTEIYQEVRLR